MLQTTFYVLGICCVDRFQLLEKLVKSVSGIISFKGTLPKGKIVVEFKEGIVSTADIITIIEKQGYSVLKKSQQNLERKSNIFN